jgi:hypothetical protein
LAKTPPVARYKRGHHQKCIYLSQDNGCPIPTAGLALLREADATVSQINAGVGPTGCKPVAINLSRWDPARWRAWRLGRALVSASPLCHGGSMDYKIVPLAGRGYWIVAIENDGSRRRVERYGTEDEAVSRLRALRQKAGIATPARMKIPNRRRDW